MRTGMVTGTVLWAVLVAGSGCESPGTSGGLLNFQGGTSEKWTIRCAHTTGAEHVMQANLLADALRRGEGLRAERVRVASTPSSSTVTYGEYVKVPSRETGRLVFPREYLRDLALVQRARYNGVPVFRFAGPELVSPGGAEGLEQWDVAHAKGPYTLQIGVFYNTPTFQDRRQAAEEYVKILRQDGFSAYYRHEPARSFVFVGDFDESDAVRTPAGNKRGPRVEKLISQRPEEFRYMLENGYRIRKKMPDGRMVVPPSMLIPVPGQESRYQGWGEPRRVPE